MLCFEPQRTVKNWLYFNSKASFLILSSPFTASQPCQPPILLCFFSSSSPSSLVSNQLQILLKLKTSLQESNPDVFSSWVSSGNMCNFTGINCNSDGFAKEIEVSNQKLKGTLPLDSVCQLQFLDKLSFGFNSLYGLVSEDLNNCTKLQYLDLGNNFFTGSFPSISYLSELRFLYLNNSGVSGVFPWKSLENMTNLISLSLGDNYFDPATFPDEVVKLNKLNWLYLANYSMEGWIPSGIGNLTELTNLELSDNNLSGEIPTEIGNLKKLWQLELYNNLLTGKLPVGFRNLSSLEKFDASRNKLEGDLSEVGFLSNLVTLHLFENQLSGEVPAELGNFQKLVGLSLYTNKLTGSLPQELGSWAEFDYIDVSENLLTGPIPPTMCKRGTLRFLLMLQNKFTGEIPASYANCVTLERFRVSNNSLSGIVPAGIWGLPKVNIIDIAMNQFEGPITKDIENAKELGFLTIILYWFEGEIPNQLTSLTYLAVLNLSYNQLVGHIPQGNQFGTFLNDCYIGNLGLCGFPLSEKCNNGLESEPDKPTIFHEEHDAVSWFDWKMSLMGYGCGVVLGLSTGYIVFSIGKPEWIVSMVDRKQSRRVRRPTGRYRRRI
ncbi:hypothetical protein Dsin_003025 [Dipteronia sinensis]|uniref:Leucine-rich repeat-containing N-terminal plant-type domain-containing protein n=1 Tax=Dipteronia sinensis TaxID=43782 RepID=A0AAE0EK85_9ROSI|nr:hypothetical protein Dsin_003025 [Dipteronia sinensis]